MENLPVQPKKNLNIAKIIPNVFTLASLGFGLTAIKLALVGNMEKTLLCLMLSMFLDGIDGRIARLIGATSDFGAHLDSLCDLANFGVCPAVIFYVWMQNNGILLPLVWPLILLYVMCMAIRLARFNVITFENDINSPNSEHDFFVGMPAPATAFLAIMPIMINFEYKFTSIININLMAIYLAIIGLMAASRIPTPSVKKTKIKGSLVWIVLVIFCLIFSFIIIEPWITLPIIGISYLLYIPIFAYKHFFNINS